MILVLTEYRWKLEDPEEDGSRVLDLVPTVGGELPIRVSLDADTCGRLGAMLTERAIAPPE